MLLFNPQYGYLEGMVRGFKNGLLNQTEYQALTQCDSLEDLKIHLAVSGNLLILEGEMTN
jgi:V-type H+-transporting ATPase subunit d